MKKSTIILLVVIAVILLSIINLVGRYNRMQQMVIEVDRGWANIEVQLQRRFDLIPNLLETVRGYAAHEMAVFTQVTEARARVGQAHSTSERVQANNELDTQIRTMVNVVVEAYPQLQANQNFVRFQDELAGTENRIAVERRRYNDAVTNLNRARVTFPNSIIANHFNIEAAEFYEAPVEAREVPRVQF